MASAATSSVSNNTGLIIVSKQRYTSDRYQIKESRRQYLQPVIIANWEKFRCQDDKPRQPNNKIKMLVEKVECTLKTKFGVGDSQLKKLYNLDKGDLIKELRDIATKFPTQGRERPDMFLCFIIAWGDGNSFYETNKNQNDMSNKIYFKDVAEIPDRKKTQEWEPEPLGGGGLFNFGSSYQRAGGVERTPVEADFLTYSFKSPCTCELESTLMHFLCEEFRKEEDHEIMDILLKVNSKVNNETGRRQCYTSDRYQIKESRRQYLQPVIIANWEKFRCQDDKPRQPNNKIKRLAEKVECTLKTKFGVGDSQLKKLYNLDKGDLIKELRDIATKFPTQGRERPDMFLCFIIAWGDGNSFYETNKNQNDMSNKIYFKDVAEIFNGEHCRGLVVRPKLFFIQTQEWEPEPLGGGGLFNFGSSYQRAGGVERTPVEADFLTYSFKSPCTCKPESTLMHFLCEEFLKEEDQEIMDILLKVNSKVNNETGRIPLCTSQLTKNLIFTSTDTVMPT